MAGLFDFQDPRQIRSDYMNSQMVSPAQMGNQDLYSKLASTMANAGTMIGTGIGGMMGGVLPKEAEQRRVQEVMKGVNLTSPESITNAANMFAKMGDNARAQALFEQADLVNQRNMAQEDRAAKQAAAEQAEQRKATLVQELVKRDPNLTPALAEVLAGDSKALMDFLNPKIKTEVVTTASGVKLINSETGTEIKNLGAAPKTGTTINNLPPAQQKAQTAYGSVVGTAQGNRDDSLVTAAEAAKSALPKILETEKLLNEGNLNTGLGASIADVFSKAQAQFLNDKKAGKRVSDSEYLDSLLGSAVFDQLSALGIGARGLDTPAEREFLLEVVTGKRTLNKDSLKRITQFRKDSALRAIGVFNNALSDGRLNEYQETVGRTFNPIEIPETRNNNIPQPTGGRPTPIYATNGQQRIVSVDGGQTWQPVR